MSFPPKRGWRQSPSACAQLPIGSIRMAVSADAIRKFRLIYRLPIVGGT
jgi:hypothetical protein